MRERERERAQKMVERSRGREKLKGREEKNVGLEFAFLRFFAILPVIQNPLAPAGK